MPNKSSPFREFSILNDKEHSESAMDDFEFLVKFLLDQLSDEQITQLSNNVANYPNEVVNALNLAIARCDYKTGLYPNKKVAALCGFNRLGGRPRIHS